MGRVIFLQLGNRDTISFKEFLKTLENFLHLLVSLDIALNKEKSSKIHWNVAVLRKQSPAVIGVQGRTTSELFADKFENELVTGIRKLTDTGERPPSYSDSVLKQVKALARQSIDYGELRIYLEGGPGPEAVINASTLTHIEQLTGTKYKALGSVLGKLESINVHNENKFRIWDENSGKSVICRYDARLEDTVKKFLRHRVLVYGLVHSDLAGQPIQIDVEGIDPATPKEELPTIEEMSGLVEDMTEGKPLKEYLEDISNG